MKRTQGTIERRKLANGDVSFRLKYRVHGRRIMETLSGCSDSRRAEHILSLRLREIEEGRWVHPKERYADSTNGKSAPTGLILFSELVEAFLEDYRPRSGKPDYYQQCARAWLRYLADLPADIDPGDIRRFARDRRERDGVTNSTVRHDLISLGTMFRWAVEQGILEASPMPRGLLRQFPAEPKRAGYLTDDEEAALLKACDDALGRWIRLAIGTGMDRAEVCELEWSQIDERIGDIHAPRGKTGEPRIIPLNKALRSLLKECRKAQGKQKAGRVLLTRRGRPWGVYGLQTALRKAYIDAGLTPRQPAKILRHTFATRLLMGGTPIAVVAALLGHSITATTETYGHVVPGATREAMASLDRRRKK